MASMSVSRFCFRLSCAKGVRRHRLRRWRGAVRAEGAPPNVASVMVDTFNITQDRIMRSRLAGDPPDHMIMMKPKSIGLFEFHRAAELIELGRLSVRKAAPELLEQLKDAIAQ